MIDTTQFWVLVGMLSVGFSWLIYQNHGLKNDLQTLEKEHGQRLSRVEGEMEGIKSMLQTIVAFLLGHKTGTGK